MGARPLPESAFQQQVIDLATVTDWLSYHTFDSRRSTPGFPDLILVRGRSLIVAELKTETGRLTGPQRVWIEAFQRVASAVELAVAGLGGVSADEEALEATVEVYVWRPSDWPEIEARLKGPRS